MWKSKGIKKKNYLVEQKSGDKKSSLYKFTLIILQFVLFFFIITLHYSIIYDKYIGAIHHLVKK